MGELLHVVVVGASLAGVRACETLRQAGFEGRITLIGAETHAPYDRPPLSKKVLAGEWSPEQILLRKPEALAELGLERRSGTRATALDTEARRVRLDDGSEVAYDGLIIATGAAPRSLPGFAPLDGVFVLRTLDDSLALRDRLAVPGTRVVVIGAGFIGLEVAATARQRGAEVTVLEGTAAPLIRGLGGLMGARVTEIHERNGVEVRCSVQVDGLADDGAGHVTGVVLGDGQIVEADVVVVGIGVSPAIEWLEGSGLELGDGIICDATLWTGAPGVYAAGDCVRWPNQLFDEIARIEHWTNAAEQGAQAARNLLASAAGEPGTPYAPVPFFWSDLFDRRVQFLGRSAPDDEVVVVYDLPDEHKFVALYGRAGKLHGVLGVSLPKLVMSYRPLLAAGASWVDALAHAETHRT